MLIELLEMIYFCALSMFDAERRSIAWGEGKKNTWIQAPLASSHGPRRDDPQRDGEDQQHRPGADGHERFHDKARVKMHLQDTHTILLHDGLQNTPL